MNLLLINESELIGDNRAVIKGFRYSELKGELKLTLGAEITVGIRNGRLGSGVVSDLGPSSFELELSITDDPPPKCKIAAIVAVSRPQIVRRAIRICCELGLSELHFIRTANCEKSYLDAAALSAKEIEQEIIKGLQQARDTVSPLIEVHGRFKPALEDRAIGAKLSTRLVKLVGDPRATTGIGKALFAKNGVADGAVIAIGSEQGFNQFELELFEQQGFERVSLGDRILRVDTALAAIGGTVQNFIN